MNKLNFNKQKKNLKNLSRDYTPNNKSVNKSIENHSSKNNNNSIEFSSNFSPKTKLIKKRNTRTNSYNIYNKRKRAFKHIKQFTF